MAKEQTDMQRLPGPLDGTKAAGKAQGWAVHYPTAPQAWGLPGNQPERGFGQGLEVLV